MKAKLFTLMLLVLVCAATASAQRPLLGKTVTGVNATSSVVVNVTLDQGVLLWGSINANAGQTVTSITAVSTGANGSFGATIDQTAQTYRILLVAGSYNLSVSFSQNSANFTYTDSTAPAPFTVSGDTMRNIALPTTSTSAVSGAVSNLNILFPSQSLTFDSTSISGFTDVSASATIIGGNYSTHLPNGMFNVQLTQTMSAFIPPSTISESNLGSNLGPFAVAGGTLNFTAPTITTATLSGTVSITGSASIPASTFLEGLDNSGAPLPQTVSSGFSTVPTNGAYSFTFGTGRAYALSPLIPVQLLPSPAPAGTYTPTAIGTSGALTTNTVLNPTYPAIPGPATGFTISGHVTITGTTKPVANASVSAFGNQLTGASNTSFERSTTTDAHGSYSLTVPSGTNYTLFVSGEFSTSGDFDQDGKADVSVFRPSTGQWFIIPSSNPGSPITQSWGLTGDIPVRGDYDGDGKADFAVWRPSTGQWFIIPSGNPGTPIVQSWGLNGDIPVPGDYDGDGMADFAVWRPSTGQWFIIPSSNPGTPIIQSFGLTGDIPVPGDYDGDGKTDFAVWRPSTGQWFVIPSSNPGTPTVQSWGLTGDVPVPGDYDGDGKTDFAVWRTSTGQWFIIPSSNPGTPIIQSWGLTGDKPVPADYDGDGKTDFAVWRPSTGQWFIIPSGTPLSPTVTSWGLSGDVPVQKPIGQ